MKICIFCLTMLFTISACSHHANQNQSDHNYSIILIQADTLSAADPDSANVLLQSIEHPEKMKDADFAYWCLIAGKIFVWRTDAGKTFLSALFYERASKYYMRHGTTEEKSYIRLYWGRAYYETAEYNKAIQIYAEALKDAETWKDYNAAGMICSYMGDIYQTQYLTDKCKEKYNEALYYFKLANNQKRVVYAYSQLGFEYLYDEKPKEGLSYLLIADSIANLIQDSISIGNISYYLGVAYSELKEYTVAEEKFLKSLQFVYTKTDLTLVYYAITDIYIATGDYRKARKALILGTNDQTKNGVLHKQCFIEKGEQNFKQALDYLEQYQKALDSIRTEQKKMRVHEIEQQYKLEYVDNLKNKALIKAQRNSIMLFIVLTGFLFTVFLYQQMYKQKNKVIAKQREELSKLDGAIEHITMQLQQEKEDMEKARLIFQNTNQEHEILLSDQQIRIKRLREELFNTRLEKITQVAHIGKKIRKITKKVTPHNNYSLSNNEWETLSTLFRTTFPALESLIRRPDNPFTESEIRSCLLAFFNLEAKQESFILNIAPYSVYKQRTRLRQTLHLEEGSDLFEFFKTYCMEQE